MLNAEQPKPEDLPSNAQLRRSSIIAAVGAAALLVTMVLPAEYGIDPTGIGGPLGLTEMGEIKQELAREAAEDALIHGQDSSSVLQDVMGFFVGTAHAQEAWRDTITFTLDPGEFTEVKVVMNEGDETRYAWVADGGRINFDLHAHGNGQSVDYERGRGQRSGEGSFTAPFPGDHGWFWRNRDSSAVTVTLQLGGSYQALAAKQ